MNPTKKKRLIGPAFLLVFALVSVVALSSGSGCKPKEMTFSDGAGRTLRLRGIPKRIVSLSPAYTETVFELGLGDRLLGVSNSCNRPPEAQRIEKVGDAFNVNLEKIVAIKPDIVLCAGTPETKYIQEIERLGIPTYVSNPSTIKEVLEDVKRVSKVLGVEKKGEELASRIQKEIDAASSWWSKGNQAKPQVFVVIDSDLWTVGPGSFIHDMLSLAGGENIMKSVAQPYLQVSMEEVLTKDPDVIVVTIPKEQYKALESRPGWSSLRAVKQGKVFFVNPDLVSRPGPSLAEGLRELASQLQSSREK